MPETRNTKPVLRMSFDTVETQLLLLWAEHVSHLTWKDNDIADAARELSERLQYAVQAQCPELLEGWEFGDFT